MKFVPFEKITYLSKLETKEILSRINEHTESTMNVQMKDVFKRKDRKYFYGKVREDKFNISRVTPNRNAFRPVIQGEINQGEAETMIIIKMKLDLAVLAFLGIFVSVVLIAMYIFILASIGEGELDYILFIPPGILIFIYCVVLIGFKSEASTAKKYLEKLLEANILKNA